MALADICGLNEASIFMDAQFSPSAFYNDVEMQSCNIENSYQLAQPPYSNVRLWIALLGNK